MITGALQLYAPSRLTPGKQIQVNIDADLEDNRRWPTDFWRGRIVVLGNGVNREDEFSGFGKVIGPEVVPSFDLGTMPMNDVSFTVELWGFDAGEWYTPPWDKEWVKVRSRTFTIAAAGTDGDGNGGLPEDMWLWLGAGAAVLLLGLIVRGERKR